MIVIRDTQLSVQDSLCFNDLTSLRLPTDHLFDMWVQNSPQPINEESVVRVTSGAHLLTGEPVFAAPLINHHCKSENAASDSVMYPP